MSIQSYKLSGLSIAVTGTLENFTRQQAIDAVVAGGGRFAKGVSTQTSYLVAGSGGGSKLARARSLNVPVLDESAFIDLLEGDTDRLPAPNPGSTGDASIELDTIVLNEDGVETCAKCNSVELVKFGHTFGDDSIWICEGLHANANRHALYNMGYEPVEQTHSGNVHRVANGCGRDEKATTILEEEVTCAACLGRIGGAVHLADREFEPVCNVAHLHQVRLTRATSHLTCPNCRTTGVEK